MSDRKFEPWGSDAHSAEIQTQQVLRRAAEAVQARIRAGLTAFEGELSTYPPESRIRVTQEDFETVMGVSELELADREFYAYFLVLFGLLGSFCNEFRQTHNPDAHSKARITFIRASLALRMRRDVLEQLYLKESEERKIPKQDAAAKWAHIESILSGAFENALKDSSL